MIFQICREVGLPIWHCDKLVHTTGIFDIGLIQDDTNIAAPQSGPRVDVPLVDGVVEEVEQM